jgi:DNA repair protein RadD
MLVSGWQWRVHHSRKSGKDMLKVSYYGGLGDAVIDEYFAITHDGYARQKALQKLSEVATQAKIVAGGLAVDSLEQMVENLQAANAPKMIKYKRAGKFYDILERNW